MRTFVSLCLIFALSQSVFSQVGIGTTTPRGALDINNPTSNTQGLVLPTNSNTSNILNPQGGTVAEGTIIYDSMRKCARLFTGAVWTNCLSDSSGGSTGSTGTPDHSLDCNAKGFTGNYVVGAPLLEHSYSASVINNTGAPISFNFTTSDLSFSGVSGISVASVTPASVTVNPGQTEIAIYTLTGTPASQGTLISEWTVSGETCYNSVQVNPEVRFAFWEDFAIGGDNFEEFRSQLEDTNHYGSTGFYNGVSGFIFTDITSSYDTESAASLISKYDVICVGGGTSMNATEASLLKAYIDGGGVAFILLDASRQTNLLNEFGGTGSVSSGVTSATTNNNIINDGVFGDSRNIDLFGTNSAGRIFDTQLPPGATVLATNSTHQQVFLTGNDDSVIFIWDEGVYRDGTITNADIDTPQEIYLHNLMAYALDKAGF